MPTPEGVADTAPRGGIRPANVAVLVPFLLVALLASRLIIDNSFLWHIRAGAVQSAAQHVLTTDVFSFTAAGSEWRTQSWLLELGYAWAEGAFGSLAWANWMMFLFAGATAVFLALAVFRSTPSPITTAFVLLIGVWLMGPFIQPRPVLASYALAAALVVVLQHKDRVLWAIVPIFWIWAAIHGSWPLGGLYLVMEWIRTGDRRLFRVGGFAAVATLLTAHGWGAWEVVMQFGASQETLGLIEEWKVPDFVSVVQGPFLLLIVAIIVAAIRGRIAMRDLLTIVPFIIVGMNARRTVFPAAIVLLPWAALAVPPFKASVALGSRMLVRVTAAAVLLLILLPMMVRPLGKLSPERFPTPELVAAFGGDLQFNGSGEGGYLIYSDWPQLHVFIDDRAELYPYEHLAEYHEIIRGDYEEAFHRWDIEVALTQRDWTLTETLRRDGWAIRAENEHFLVFGRP